MLTFAAALSAFAAAVLTCQSLTASLLAAGAAVARRSDARADARATQTPALDSDRGWFHRQTDQREGVN